MVEDFKVFHVTIYDRFIQLSNFFPHRHEVLVAVVLHDLQLFAVTNEKPDWQESFQLVVVNVELLKLRQVYYAFTYLLPRDFVVGDVEFLQRR